MGSWGSLPPGSTNRRSLLSRVFLCCRAGLQCGFPIYPFRFPLYRPFPFSVFGMSYFELFRMPDRAHFRWHFAKFCLIRRLSGAG